jgi:hypothetical protein
MRCTRAEVTLSRCGGRSGMQTPALRCVAQDVPLRGDGILGMDPATQLAQSLHQGCRKARPGAAVAHSRGTLAGVPRRTK